MNKKNPNILLKRAENLFISEDYINALKNYGLILKDYPLLDDAKVGVYLSDLGMDNHEEAQVLFDYYQIIKIEKDNAVEIIDDLINSLNSSKQSIQELLEPLEDQLEYGDGIGYSDFLELVESRGNFKQTFEDIMFSTKVVISSKDEFIDFVTQLSQEGFDQMALGYLDSSARLFGNDQDILALYHTIRGVK